FTVEGLAYVANGRLNGLQIFDISDLAHPQLAGIYNQNESPAVDVVVSGDYAYVAFFERYLQ
ncbi:MAG: hypothetical protein KJ687_02070, partial [Proteobacteria bacterium]|nr:hypothetical protein [Pseudomonadota bacterium]